MFLYIEAGPNVREQEAGPSEAKKTVAKQINPMGQLSKVLKFKLCLEADRQDAPC